jgi:hypothetical protein
VSCKWNSLPVRGGRESIEGLSRDPRMNFQEIVTGSLLLGYQAGSGYRIWHAVAVERGSRGVDRRAQNFAAGRLVAQREMFGVP